MMIENDDILNVQKLQGKPKRLEETTKRPQAFMLFQDICNIFFGTQ